MRYFALLSSVAMLAGCANMNPQPSRSASSILAADPSQFCFSQMSPSIRGVGVSAAPPSMEMLADRSRATEEERRQLLAFSNDRSACIERGSQYRRDNLPVAVRGALERSYTRGTANLAKLYAGDITFGEYHASRAASGEQAQADLQAFDSASAQAQSQMEAQRRAVLLGIIQDNQDNLARQQQIQQMNRPRQTNCQAVLNQVNCTTY